MGRRHVLPARRQHRRHPPRELPERAGGPGHEGGAGAHGLGDLVRRRRSGGPGTRAVPRVPPGLREEPGHRAGQHHAPGRGANGGRPDGPLRPLHRAERRILRTPPVRRRGAHAAVFPPAPARLQADQGPRRRRAPRQRAGHGTEGPPGPDGRRVVDPRDGRGAHRGDRDRHPDRPAAEPVDPGADPGGDALRPRDGPGRPRTGRPRPVARRAGRVGRRLQHDGPSHPRVPAGRDRQAPAGPEDGAGDDRLVPRPGRGPRPVGLGRAIQPLGPPSPGRRPGRGRGGPLEAARPARASTDRRAQGRRRLPADQLRAHDRPPRGRPRAPPAAPHPGDPRRVGGDARRGRGPHRRHPIPADGPDQERHGLHRQPRAEDAADEHPDGGPPPPGGGRRAAQPQAGRAAGRGPPGLRPACWR